MGLTNWIIGLLVSLIAGCLITQAFVCVMQSTLNVSKPESKTKRFPPWLTGFIERTFFTILVGLNASGVSSAMMAWLALKMATNWNHPDWKDKPEARTLAFIALLSGLISLLMAYLGGNIANGTITFTCP